MTEAVVLNFNDVPTSMGKELLHVRSGAELLHIFAVWAQRLCQPLTRENVDTSFGNVPELGIQITTATKWPSPLSYFLPKFTTTVEVHPSIKIDTATEWPPISHRWPSHLPISRFYVRRMRHYEDIPGGFTAAVRNGKAFSHSVAHSWSLPVENPGLAISVSFDSGYRVESDTLMQQTVFDRLEPDGTRHKYAGIHATTSTNGQGAILGGILWSSNNRNRTSAYESVDCTIDSAGAAVLKCTRGLEKVSLNGNSALGGILWSSNAGNRTSAYECVDCTVDSAGAKVLKCARGLEKVSANSSTALLGLLERTSKVTEVKEQTLLMEVTSAGDLQKQTFINLEQRNYETDRCGFISSSVSSGKIHQDEEVASIRKCKKSGDVYMSQKRTVRDLAYHASASQIQIPFLFQGVGTASYDSSAFGGHTSDTHGRASSGISPFALWGSSSASYHETTQKTDKRISHSTDCSWSSCRLTTCTSISITIRHHEKSTECEQLFWIKQCRLATWKTSWEYLPTETQCAVEFEWPTKLYTSLHAGAMSSLGVAVAPIAAWTVSGPRPRFDTLLLSLLVAFTCAFVQAAIVSMMQHALLGHVLGLVFSGAFSACVAYLRGSPFGIACITTILQFCIAIVSMTVSCVPYLQSVVLPVPFLLGELLQPNAMDVRILRCMVLVILGHVPGIGSLLCVAVQAAWHTITDI